MPDVSGSSVVRPLYGHVVVVGAAGVPQGRMLHALMPRGLQIVERLFPGYCHESEAAGAVPVRVRREITPG
jgi:hypothetical protein